MDMGLLVIHQSEMELRYVVESDAPLSSTVLSYVKKELGPNRYRLEF